MVMEKQNLKKKKATKKEIKELRELVIEIQNDPVAMRQVKRFISQTA